MIARFAEFELDPGPRQLTRAGAPVHLAPKAFDLLLLLIEEAPRIVRKDELHQRLWPGTFVADTTLVSVVKELRRALNDGGSTSPIIRTAHRVGYGFAAAIEKGGGSSSGISRWIVAGRRRISLADGAHLIGRDPSSAVCLDTPGVSRRHARILVDGRDAFLEDLGSKNGTAVSGQTFHGRIALRDGDEIRVGSATILYRSSELGESTETMVRSASGAAGPARQRDRGTSSS